MGRPTRLGLVLLLGPLLATLAVGALPQQQVRREWDRLLLAGAVYGLSAWALYRVGSAVRRARRGELLLGVAASTWQAVRATQAEAVALANEQNANEHAAQANQQRDDARALAEKLQATQAHLQRTLYASNMNLARHAWDEAAVSRVRELLDAHRPKPGEPDLRGFEWHYLHRLSHAELMTLKGGGGKVVYSAE